MHGAHLECTARPALAEPVALGGKELTQLLFSLEVDDQGLLCRDNRESSTALSRSNTCSPRQPPTDIQTYDNQRLHSRKAGPVSCLSPIKTLQHEAGVMADCIPFHALHFPGRNLPALSRLGLNPTSFAQSPVRSFCAARVSSRTTFSSPLPSCVRSTILSPRIS